MSIFDLTIPSSSFKTSNQIYTPVITYDTSCTLPFYIALYDATNSKGVNITDINDISDITVTCTSNSNIQAIITPSVKFYSGLKVISINTRFTIPLNFSGNFTNKISYTYNSKKSPEITFTCNYKTAGIIPITPDIPTAYYMIFICSGYQFDVFPSDIAFYTDITYMEKIVMYGAYGAYNTVFYIKPNPCPDTIYIKWTKTGNDIGESKRTIYKSAFKNNTSSDNPYEIPI